MRAQKTIADGNYSPTDHEGIYRLYLIAYDDEQLASRARLKAMEAMVNDRCSRK